MTTADELLHNAYEYIEAGNFPYANALLESLINLDPTNIEGWEACMQISQTCEELDGLCEQVLRIPELSASDRDSILDYYYFLRQKLRNNTPKLEAHAPEMVTYELVNQFSFSLKDQPARCSNDLLSKIDFQQGLTWLLDKAIISLYLVLLVTGLKLVGLGNNFGYWIIMVLAMSVFVNLWNMILPGPDSDPLPTSNQTESSEALDEVFRVA